MCASELGPQMHRSSRRRSLFMTRPSAHRAALLMPLRTFGAVSPSHLLLDVGGFSTCVQEQPVCSRFVNFCTDCWDLTMTTCVDYLQNMDVSSKPHSILSKLFAWCHLLTLSIPASRQKLYIDFRVVAKGMFYLSVAFSCVRNAFDLWMLTTIFSFVLNFTTNDPPSLLCQGFGKSFLLFRSFKAQHLKQKIVIALDIFVFAVDFRAQVQSFLHVYLK